MSGEKGTVFISYSHRDEQWKDRLLPYFSGLERMEVWHDRHIGPGQKWLEEIKNAIDQAKVAVCLITRNYLASDFTIRYELPGLLDRRERSETFVVPILIEDCPWREYPQLKSIQMFPRDGRAIADLSEDDQKEALRQLPNWIEEGLQHRAPLEGKAKPRPADVNIARLPLPNGEFFGRLHELQVLDEAWESFDTHVVSIIGQGGVGKSTLVDAWLKHLGESHFQGAERVYGWSFYSSQSGDRFTSADEFLTTALEWFGESPSLDMPAWEKGNLLAEQVSQRPCILVLDGFETVQSLLSFERGRIIDLGLARLVARLAQENRGLLVLTTRVQVPLLQRHKNAHELALDRISIEAGASILRSHGVCGEEAELMEASMEFGSHALTISLLGAYLKGSADRSLKHLEEIDRPLPEDGEGPCVQGILEAFERRLGQGPELQLLSIVSLFEKPCQKHVIAALCKGASPIRQLTDQLGSMTAEEWQPLLKRLREMYLLAPQSRHQSNLLDTHPLIRDHFRNRLQTHSPKSWRLANSRLYRHYYLAAPASPTTVEELVPLYDALLFGVRAGHHQAVLDDVYWTRLLKHNEQFSWSKLGAADMDLAALSHFFEQPWEKLFGGIREKDAGFVLGQAGLYLGMLGRLRESVQPLRLGIQRDMSQNRILNAAVTTGNLASVLITLGDLKEGLSCASESVRLADLADDLAERAISRTHVGRALHYCGRCQEARLQFEEAERLQRQTGSATPFLYGGHGWAYSDLQLEQGQWAEVIARSNHNLKHTPSHMHEHELLALGLGIFSRVRSEGVGNLLKALQLLDRSVDLLRNDGQIDQLLTGLLARAKVRRYGGFHDQALEDLEEALQLADLANARVHQAEAHLLWARLQIDHGHRSHAAESLEAAARLVKATGYKRMSLEVGRLKGRLGGVPGRSQSTKPS